MSRNIFTWIIVIIIITTFSCARQSAPTGGPKDTIPPVLDRSSPAQNQINYKGNTIELSFSEMIALANPKEQIIIAPTTDNTYEITNRNNRVIIKFDRPLQDSVTYSINFRDAVQDVTEKNPVENLQLAFSTGTYIDSLKISGTVNNLITGTPPKEATIAIFPANDTLSIFKHKPVYLTKSNKKGEFTLRNLKPGDYYIYAIEDKNKNLIADSRSEPYAFRKSPLTLTTDTSDINLPLIRLDARTLRLTNSRPYNTYFNIKTSKNLDAYKLTSHDTVVSSYGEDRANIRVYNTFNTDSTRVTLNATDSIGNKIDTTFYIKFINREVTPEKFSMSIQSGTVLTHRGTIKATLHFNKPVAIQNTDSLLFQIDSLNTVSLADANFKWDHTLNDLTITKKFDASPYTKANAEKNSRRDNPTKLASTTSPKKETFINELVFGRGTFLSIDRDTSASVKKVIKPQQLEDLGSLTVQIETKEPYFITELLNTEYQRIRSTINEKKVRWEDIEPGNYRIRLIIDKNQNGKWDAGNYFLKEEPEPIIYLIRPQAKPENTLFIRSNWDVDDVLIKY